MFSTVILYQFVIRQERLELIDGEITSIATILLNSDLINLTSIDFTGVEDIISKQIGEERIGKFFILRNSKGVVLYKSISAQILNIDEAIPTAQKWTTITRGPHRIRILSVALPSVPDRRLQVGHMINENILSFGELLSPDKFLFLIFIFITGLTVSWLLTSKLLQPLSVFSRYIARIAENNDGKLELPPLPPSLSKLMKTDGEGDDFKSLVGSFDKLIVRVNSGFKMSRFWSYQMAHELKTPMAVIESTVSKALRDKNIDGATATNIITEVLEVSETISSFLNWAEVENSLAPPQAHVTKLCRAVTTLVERLNLKYNDRISVNCEKDFSVYCNQQQLELVISNLVSNACKYSSKPVDIFIANRTLNVIDHGKPISQKVLDHLGEPFNACESNTRKSSGLGLAYVYSVCRIFQWKLEILPTARGNRVSITFPELEMELDEDPSLKMEKPDSATV